MLIESCLQGVYHLKLFCLQITDLMTQILDTVADCHTLLFLYVLIHQLSNLFLEKLSLLEILLLVSNVLSMLELLGLVVVAGRLGLKFNLSSFLLLSQTLLLKVEHVLVGVLQLLGIRLVFHLPDGSVCLLELFLALFLSLHLAHEILDFASVDLIAAINLDSRVENLGLVLLLLGGEVLHTIGDGQVLGLD